jgi:DNA polymerase-3 subunit chi
VDILFYHLTETRVDDALPPLLEKSLERGWRVVVQTKDAARRDGLDLHLWTWREASFIPHGTDEAEFAGEQPVLLTSTGGNANKATVRFLVDGAEPSDLVGYDRVVFMFDGHDDRQLTQARQQWKSLKSDGHTLSYWQQNGEGRWEKKA